MPNMIRDKLCKISPFKPNFGIGSTNVATRKRRRYENRTPDPEEYKSEDEYSSSPK